MLQPATMSEHLDLVATTAHRDSMVVVVPLLMMIAADGHTRYEHIFNEEFE
jgi:hypothetical protein